MPDRRLPSKPLASPAPPADPGIAFVVGEPVVEAGWLSPTPGLALPRVLLIEDDFILRAHLAELLMCEGYRVSCAADGAEALRRLQTEPLPAVILTDILLPRMDGVAFRQAQLRTPAWRDIPTIAVTSLRDLGGRPDPGFTEVMRKPLNVDHLFDVLAQLCPRA